MLNVKAGYILVLLIFFFFRMDRSLPKRRLNFIHVKHKCSNIISYTHIVKHTIVTHKKHIIVVTKGFEFWISCLVHQTNKNPVIFGQNTKCRQDPTLQGNVLKLSLKKKKNFFKIHISNSFHFPL